MRRYRVVLMHGVKAGLYIFISSNIHQYFEVCTWFLSPVGTRLHNSTEGTVCPHHSVPVDGYLPWVR